MVLETVVTGNIQENCYLAGSPDELLVIDPGDEAEKILSRIEAGNYRVKYVVLTHCHYDHIGAAAEVKEETGAQLVICAKERGNYLDPHVNLMGSLKAGGRLLVPERTVSEGDTLESGGRHFTVIETPGHTSGGMCLLCGGDLFSGDTLFQRGIGRVDLPTGNLRQIIASIKNKLFALPEETRVYPGHGPATTIGYEKKHNEVYEWERYQDE